ncbi:MAG TPA: hypothetical protein VFB21_04430 [Chthonomonadaceae bacterium]|nr:hypothetical protein [Chthonomonadaceae bacterium]
MRTAATIADQQGTAPIQEHKAAPGDSTRLDLNRSSSGYTNAAGQIAWSALQGRGTQARFHAFLSTQGKILNLGTLGGRSSTIAGLNAAGHVIGWSETPHEGQHAFLWKDGRMTDLGVLPGGKNSYAYALNDQDQVVGKSEVSGQLWHDFLWSEGKLADLGVLRGGTESGAQGLNSRGEVVGWSEDSQERIRAVVWKQGKPLDLSYEIAPGSGYVLEYARAIHEAGQIEGVGKRNGQTQAFLLMPR